MTTLQIKSEIQKVLDKVPEDALKDILNYLKVIESESHHNGKLAGNLRKILSEDRELLKKLAE
ncbi:MAG: hypothetical protein EOP47_27615 [Sphingobacteriaceae bacterium]|nr:MAG: hypothetical protein EOP47_27615 [Sphingobacteriaceae bacterium]